MLTKENQHASSDVYFKKKHKRASYAARTMPMTGVIILCFIIFHILHYTVRTVPEPYGDTIGNAAIEVNHVTLAYFDVYAMMVKGFSSPLVSGFYILAVALLCMHLSHGVSSMLQSIGLRNEHWRGRLDKIAMVYGWVIFLGFASIPTAVLAGVGKDYLKQREATNWELKLEKVGNISHK